MAEVPERDSAIPETAIAAGALPEVGPAEVALVPPIDTPPTDERVMVPGVSGRTDVSKTPPVDRLAGNADSFSGISRDNPSTSEMPTTNKNLVTSAAPEPQRRVGAVMVLEIVRTESGRMSRSVRTAMKSAAFNMRNEKLIAEDIVSVLGDGRSDDEFDRGASVLYLEGTAKQLDRFILSLCSDEEGIDTIRFGLASELPILNLLQQLQRPIDPKTVRHSASWFVQGDTIEGSRLLTGALVDRTMVPLEADVASLGVVAGGGTRWHGCHEPIVGRCSLVRRSGWGGPFHV